MAQFRAHILNSCGSHQVTLATNDNAHSIVIPPAPGGFGSRARGGELLFLAMATCYCNDIYREAARLNITVHSVEVEVTGDFAGVPGNVAENVVYTAAVEADASEEEILALMHHTDTVAEIQNCLRQGISVQLGAIKAIPRGSSTD